MDQEEHLKPFMTAMDEAKSRQGNQGAGKIQFAGMLDLQQDRQSHAKKGEPVEKVNSDDIFDKNIQKQIVDSSFYIKKKKGFLSRVRDVFTSEQDSIKVLSKQAIETKDTTYLKPAKLLTDTIVQYINNINYKSGIKKARYITCENGRYSLWWVTYFILY